jgi:hypothetical protein
MKNTVLFLSLLLSFFIWTITIASSHKLNTESVQSNQKQINFKNALTINNYNNIVTKTTTHDINHVRYNMLGLQASKELIKSDDFTKKSMTAMIYYKLLN